MILTLYTVIYVGPGDAVVTTGCYTLLVAVCVISSFAI